MKYRSAALCILAIAASSSTYAGNLNPPAGPIAPTGMTITELQPRIAINATNTPGGPNNSFRITQPGSYYLPGNFTGESGKNGIEIASSGVTLDLMGFELRGVAGSLRGITVNLTVNVHIRNGSVRDWGGIGVSAFSASNSSLRDLLAEGNGLVGLFIGHNGQVEACAAQSNGSDGISANDACMITGCSARLNGGFGIVAGPACMISGNVVNSNTSIGILVGPASTVRGNTSVSNSGFGIRVDFGCTVSGNTSSLNTGDGLSTTFGCTVIGNTAYLNTGDGIQTSGGCYILNNNCSFNGNLGDGAGIHTDGGGTRIEANNVTFNDRGIDVDFAGNFIVGNSASGNGVNYDIAANNVYGPVIDRTVPVSGAVLGDSAVGAVGTSNAWANFAY